MWISSKVLPMLVGLFCLCNLLNVHSRFVSLCGWDMLEVEWLSLVSSVDTKHLLLEGRRLIERERQKRSEDRGGLLDMHERGEASRATVPLRWQIAALIEDGTLPVDWNAASPP
mmetsp:Transcript_13123/g.46651  ORF Transcript_13123/g.46651 Transcript_13123/m.46651 type:complete len:114 (+) Transcript_13123:90-431(+)